MLKPTFRVVCAVLWDFSLTAPDKIFPFQHLTLESVIYPLGKMNGMEIRDSVGQWPNLISEQCPPALIFQSSPEIKDHVFC